MASRASSMDDDRLAEQESLPYGSYDEEEDGQVRQARLVRLRGLFKSLGRFVSLRHRRRRRRGADDEDSEALADDPDEFGFAVTEDGDADETLLDVDLTPKFAEQLCESPTSTRAFSFVKIDADGESETPSRRSSISLPFFLKDDVVDATLTQDAGFVLAGDLQPVIACGRCSRDVIHIPVVPALQLEVPARSVYAEYGWHEPLFDGPIFLHDMDHDARSCSTVTPDTASELERLLCSDSASVRF